MGIWYGSIGILDAPLFGKTDGCEEVESGRVKSEEVESVVDLQVDMTVCYRVRSDASSPPGLA